MQHAFFSEDYREGAVRSKAAVHGSFFLNVISYAGGAAFLITAHYQTDPLIYVRLYFIQDLHGIKSAQNTALIIRSTTAIVLAVNLRHLERISLPGIGNRNNIQVSDDADDFITLAHFNVTGVIVNVDGFETFSSTHFQGSIQTVDVNLTKWFGIFVVDGRE